MVIRQARIFVPNSIPYDGVNWAETLLGRLVQPLIQSHTTLDWFWFSRYVAPPSIDSGDCEVNIVPKEFQIDGSLRSLRLRFEIPDSDMQEFEENGSLRIREENCVISDWRDYGLVADLGGDRFVGEDRDNARRIERAKLVVSLLHSLSKLILHTLIGPDTEGGFHIESNDDQQNPLHSSFNSIHHLFCNMTAVPLRVLLLTDGSQNTIGTDWYRPQGVNWEVSKTIPIHY